MCFVPIQDSLRGWLAFTAISKQVNVRKLGLSLSLLADPPIFLGSVRMISMRSQANLRKLEAALRPARQMDRFRRTIHLCNFIDLGCWFPLHLVKKSPYWWLHSHPPWKGPCHHCLEVIFPWFHRPPYLYVLLGSLFDCHPPVMLWTSNARFSAFVLFWGHVATRPKMCWGSPSCLARRSFLAE